MKRPTQFRTAILPLESQAVREPARPRALGIARAVWRELKEVNARSSDSWVDDLLALICFWVLLLGGPWVFVIVKEVFK